MQKGFTLLELMLVLALIGLLSGLGVALLDGGEGSRKQARLELLADEFRLARELALRSGEVLGWRSEGDGYRFLRLQAGAGQPRWEALPGDALRSGAWPQGLRPQAAGMAVWWPSGESDPLSLSFDWGEGERRLRLLADGRVTLERLP